MQTASDFLSAPPVSASSLAEPFLLHVAQELAALPDRSQWYVVLPSRRACTYLKYYLGQALSGQSAPLLPQVLSMEDFSARLGQLQKADRTLLLLHLFQVYRNVQPGTALEEFLPMGQALLREFSVLDNNLDQAQVLSFFSELEEAKAMERWSAQLSGEEDLSPSQHLLESLAFWQSLRQVYADFRAQLLERRQGYSGLVARRALECLREQGLPDVAGVLFAGFSQLSTVEQQLIEECVRQGIGALRFDADVSYIRDAEHEAGVFLRAYARGFAQGHADLGRDLLRTPGLHTPVRLLAMPTVSAQAKMVGQQLEALIAQGPDRFRSTTNFVGVLLPDETLLPTLLHALPEYTFADGSSLADHVNITMGVTLRNTPLFDLVESLFALQSRLRETDGQVEAHYRDVLAVVRHPFLRRNTADEEFGGISDGVQQQLLREGRVYVPLATLREWGGGHPLYDGIFRSWGRDYLRAIGQLRILCLLIEELFERPQHLHADSEPQVTPLSEYISALLLSFFTELNRLEQTLPTCGEQISLPILHKMLGEYFSATSLPFSGEPIAPLQIMGMLESRALDFEHVFVLSCNEGKLPAKKQVESIFPFEVKNLPAYRLPTFRDNDVNYAYTFYRLLHRAGSLTYLYADPSACRDEGERSRFLMQLEKEVVPAFPERFSLQHYHLAYVLPEAGSAPQMPVDEALRELLLGQFKRGLAPSSLNQYVKSPLMFLEQRLLGIREAEEIEESMDQRTFGLLLHGALEEMLKDACAQGTPLTADFWEGMRQQTDHYMQRFLQLDAKKDKSELKGQDFAYGTNLLLYRTALSLLDKFLRKEQEMSGQQPLKRYVLGLELPLRCEMQLQVPLSEGRTLQVPFALTGFADRIDLEGDVVRVIDYKTGRLADGALKVAHLGELLDDPEKEKVMQLLLYRYLVLKSLRDPRSGLHKRLSTLDRRPGADVQAGFYFFRNLDKGFLTYEVEHYGLTSPEPALELPSGKSKGKKEKEEEEKPVMGDEEFFQQVEALLSALLSRMLQQPVPLQ